MNSPKYAPIFRYPGGKSKPQAYEKIKSLFPKNYRGYREPFVGGLFFSLDSSMPRWINDVNRPLVAVHEALKSRPKECIETCMAISPASPAEGTVTARSGMRYPKRLWDLFHRVRDNETADPALRFLFLNRCARFGRVILDARRTRCTEFSNPQGWSHGLFHRMARAAEALADAKITCSDFTSGAR